MKRLFLLLLITCLCVTPVSADPSNTVMWQSYENQSIKTGKWVTMQFKKNRTDIVKNGKGRTLYCSKVHLNFIGKKNPKYVKLRLARVLPNGKLDTTGTNTWVLGKSSPKKWQGSMCWSIDTEYPVRAQIKIGGKGSYTSTLRQFKAWSPETDFPVDMLEEGVQVIP